MLLLFDEKAIFYSAKSLCSIMPEQPIELPLLNIEFLTKTLLHCLTSNNNTRIEIFNGVSTRNTHGYNYQNNSNEIKDVVKGHGQWISNTSST